MLADRRWNRGGLIAEARLLQHFQKLVHRTHVGGLRNEFAITVVYEGLRNALNQETFLDFTFRIEQDWIGEFPGRDERANFGVVFIRDGKDYKSFTQISTV